VSQGPDWAVAVDGAVVRAHQHAAGARHAPPVDIDPEVLQPTMIDTGAGSNDNNRATRPSREGIGRSRGGLTSKIHLAADRRARPISRVTTAGHRHDSLAFPAVMTGIRIRRHGPGRPRTRPGRVLADKAYSSRAIRSYLRLRGIKARSPSRLTRRSIGTAVGAAVVARQGSTPSSTSSASVSNGRSTSSRVTAQSPPDTTSATTSSAAPSTSPRSGSGYATPSH